LGGVLEMRCRCRRRDEMQMDALLFDSLPSGLSRAEKKKFD